MGAGQLRAYLAQIPSDKKGDIKKEFIDLEKEVCKLINKEWKEFKKASRKIYTDEKTEA